MSENIVKYRKARAVVFYSFSAVFMSGALLSLVWVDQIPKEILFLIGIKPFPMPIGDKIVFAIIFVSLIFTFHAFMVIDYFQRIDKHAKDRDYYKVQRRSWISRLIEGSYDPPISERNAKMVLPEDEVRKVLTGLTHLVYFPMISNSCLLSQILFDSVIGTGFSGLLNLMIAVESMVFSGIKKVSVLPQTK